MTEKFIKDGPHSISAHPGLDELMKMSFSRDGFRREQAVRQLGSLGTPLAIPCLIVRANDWVPQVRAAAYAALTQLLDAGHAEAFAASLPAIIHLQGCGRSDHSALLQAVTRHLLRAENVSVLVAAIQNPDARVARLASRLLVEHRPIPVIEIVSKGLAHEDVIVRSIVVDLLRSLSHDDFKAVAGPALRDSYMPVRREAFQQLLRRDLEVGLQRAKELLFDASAAIREIAVHHLRAAGESIEDLYADAVSHHRDRVSIVTCALWGWGVTNSRSRIAQIQQLLDSQFPSIRRAALQSIAKLLQENAKSHLERALSDVSPAVCKEAARLICKLGLEPSVEELIEITASSEAHHVAYACCRVVHRGNKWAWLRFILSVYAAPHSHIPSDPLVSELNAWNLQFNRSGASPDQATVEVLAKLLRSSRPKLTALHARLLEFTLRSYGANL